MTSPTATARPHPLVEERHGAVSLIRLNRPDVLNALDSASLTALREALERDTRDTATRGIVLAGSDRAFCVGEDLTEARSRSSSGLTDALDDLHRITRLILDAAAPVVAAVDGYALGAGLELILACDLRIASDRACFGTPEVSVGMAVSNASSVLLPALVGAGRAREMMLTGRRFNAEWALQAGLVNAVVPTDPSVEALRWLSHVVELAPASVAAAKALLNAPIRSDVEAAMAREESAIQALSLTRDAQEALTAFEQRRPPRFTGE